jgi:hypothetical protein
MMSAPNRTADAANIEPAQHCRLSGARRVSGKFEERVAPLGPFQANAFRRCSDSVQLLKVVLPCRRDIRHASHFGPRHHDAARTPSARSSDSSALDTRLHKDCRTRNLRLKRCSGFPLPCSWSMRSQVAHGSDCLRRARHGPAAHSDGQRRSLARGGRPTAPVSPGRDFPVDDPAGSAAGPTVSEFRRPSRPVDASASRPSAGCIAPCAHCSSSCRGHGLSLPRE